MRLLFLKNGFSFVLCFVDVRSFSPELVLVFKLSHVCHIFLELCVDVHWLRLILDEGHTLGENSCLDRTVVPSRFAL